MTDEPQANVPARLKVEIEGTEIEYLRYLGKYSVDEGVTWHPSLLDAYKARPAPRAERAGEGFEAFVVSLLGEIRDLKPGESLRIARDQETLAVVKESMVLATRVSTIGDIDLRLEPRG